MRQATISWVLLGLGIIFGAVSNAEELQETPTELPGGYIIGAEETHVLIGQGSIYLADCRSPFNYGKGHLPGATSLEYQLNYHQQGDDDTSSGPRIDLAALSENKKEILIFYSHGPTGWKSYHAAQAAIAAGYSQVHWFRGGVQAWLEAGHPLEY